MAARRALYNDRILGSYTEDKMLTGVYTYSVVVQVNPNVRIIIKYDDANTGEVKVHVNTIDHTLRKSWQGVTYGLSASWDVKGKH